MARVRVACACIQASTAGSFTSSRRRYGSTVVMPNFTSVTGSPGGGAGNAGNSAAATISGKTDATAANTHLAWRMIDSLS